MADNALQHQVGLLTTDLYLGGTLLLTPSSLLLVMLGSESTAAPSMKQLRLGKLQTFFWEVTHL